MVFCATEFDWIFFVLVSFVRTCDPRLCVATTYSRESCVSISLFSPLRAFFLLVCESVSLSSRCRWFSSLLSLHFCVSSHSIRVNFFFTHVHRPRADLHVAYYCATHYIATDYGYVIRSSYCRHHLNSGYQPLPGFNKQTKFCVADWPTHIKYKIKINFAVRLVTWWPSQSAGGFFCLHLVLFATEAAGLQ